MERVFLDMAKHYGFLPGLCKPYRVRTKGKAECFHRYLRGNFYVPHSSCMKACSLIVDPATANAEVGKCSLDVLNRRVHPQIGHAPQTLYKNVEKVLLEPLPNHASRSQSDRHIPPMAREQIHALQHPLSIFHEILIEVSA